MSVNVNCFNFYNSFFLYYCLHISHLIFRKYIPPRGSLKYTAYRGVFSLLMQQNTCYFFLPFEIENLFLPVNFLFSFAHNVKGCTGSLGSKFSKIKSWLNKIRSKTIFLDCFSTVFVKHIIKSVYHVQNRSYSNFHT